MLHVLQVPLVTCLAFGGGDDVAQADVRIVEASAARRTVVPGYSLSALMEAPDEHFGEAVAAVVQFHELVDDWTPYLSRFTPEAYVCASVWADEQWLWLADEYEAPMARVFARKGTFAEAILSSAKAHDRYEFDLVVRELHAGAAWIEVVGARWTREQTPEGTVLHAIRAMDMIEREGFALAVSELDRALRPLLPSHVRRELETVREDCEALLVGDR